jgi:hypothetical protein
VEFDLRGEPGPDGNYVIENIKRTPAVSPPADGKGGGRVRP